MSWPANQNHPEIMTTDLMAEELTGKWPNDKSFLWTNGLNRSFVYYFFCLLGSCSLGIM